MTTSKARALRRSPTDAERLLRTHLRYRQMNGHKFRRQHAIGQYIVDFACLERRLIIEVDGGHHNDSPHAGYDAVRTAGLESQGYQVLRFGNHQVLQEVEAVKARILQALEDPHPNPPPERGRGLVPSPWREERISSFPISGGRPEWGSVPPPKT